MVGDLDKYTAFVHFGDKSVRATTLMNAAKICLDYYLAINIEYQEECKQVWFFIQSLCQNKTQTDPQYPSVVTLLNDLKSL